MLGYGMSANQRTLNRKNTASRNISSRDGAIIGVSDHGGWAVLVTVASDGKLPDRRRVELVDKGLPKIPHHSEGLGTVTASFVGASYGGFLP